MLLLSAPVRRKSCPLRPADRTCPATPIGHQLRLSRTPKPAQALSCFGICNARARGRRLRCSRTKNTGIIRLRASRWHGSAGVLDVPASTRHCAATAWTSGHMPRRRAGSAGRSHLERIDKDSPSLCRPIASMQRGVNRGLCLGSRTQCLILALLHRLAAGATCAAPRNCCAMRAPARNERTIEP